MNLFFKVSLCAFLFVSCKKSNEILPGSGQEETEQPEIPTEISGEFPRQNRVSDERVFSENLLKSWGYETSHFEENAHRIKSIKNYGSAELRSYARFEIQKAVFPNEAEATSVKAKIEIVLQGKASFKNYTKILQARTTLYAVQAISNATRIEHQPHLVETIQAHLDSDNP